jgi:hypothetical protein
MRGLGFFIEPFAPSRKRWSNGCRQLMLRIERTALDRVFNRRARPTAEMR